MKIAVIGANSTLGRKVVNKAEARGIAVVGMVRTAERLVGDGPLVLKPYHELTNDDLAGCHAVVDTVSFPHVDRYAGDDLPLWHLLTLCAGGERRLLAVGSCAFLYVDGSRRRRVADDEGVAAALSAPILRQCARIYDRLRTVGDVHWGVLCPPLVVDRRGYGSGRYEFGDDLLPMGADGSSAITLVDLADATVETLLRGVPRRRCISVRAR